MGAWGYGPFETDGAGDFGDGIAKKIVAGIRSRDEQVARAAAQLLVDTDRALHIGADFASDAVGRLEEMLDDEAFLRSWDDGAKIRSAIRAQMSDLKAVVRREAARRKRYPR